MGRHPLKQESEEQEQCTKQKENYKQVNLYNFLETQAFLITFLLKK